MKIYWVHSKKIYNTPEEAEIRDILEQCFSEVICPNRDIGEKGAIQPYLDAIDTCDAVVVSEYHNHIGRGAFDEVTHAIKTRDMDVYALRNWEFVGVIAAKIVDPNDWSVNYGRLVTNVRDFLQEDI